jgi:hypothetical protein
VWAGTINFESGGNLVGVEYDSADTATALRTRCAQWLSDDTRDVPAAFGVRIARVGFRRRSVGVVHHGAPVRHRVDGGDAAVQAIATFLDEVGRPRPEGFVAVGARAFVRDDRAVLLDIPMSVDVDERPLQRLGITEVPTYRSLLDLSTSTLMVGAGAYPLVGVVVRRLDVNSLDDARRRLWALGEGPRLPWAEFIDQLGDRVVWNPPELASAFDQVLS